AAQLQFFIGTSAADPDDPYDYYVDDIVITLTPGEDPGDPGDPGEPGDPGDPGEPGEPTQPIEALNSDFEDDLNGWGPRDDAAGGPEVERSDIKAHGGNYSALVTDRSSDGHGQIGRASCR